ncbi:MAG: hypothetical protein ABJ308_15980 [Halieaceae bacterium]
MKKIYLLLAVLASLSVFSTASTSRANYGRIVDVIPPQTCEAVFGESADSLFFGAAGVVDRPEFFGNTFITCPIPRSALARPGSDIAINLRWDSFAPAPTMNCKLYEIATDPIFVQVLSRTVQLQPVQSVQAYFEGVKPLERDSAFVMECNGPAGVLVQNIEIRASRGR